MKFFAARKFNKEAPHFLRASDAMFGFMDISLLWGGVQAGIFDHLAEHPTADLDAVSAALGLKADRLEKFIKLLEARGFVIKTSAGWENEAFITKYLLKKTTRPGMDIRSYLGHWVRKMDQYGSKMAEVLKGELSSEHIWPPATKEHSDYFEKMMEAVSWPMAPLLRCGYDFSKHKKILDVGGGNGAIALELAEAFPAVRFGLLNVSSGLAAARENILKRGFEGRIDLLEGDYRKAIPAYGDALLWIRNMHDYSEAVRERLARNAWEALPEGGVLLVCEGLRNPETLRGYAGYMYSTIPLPGASFYTYTFEEYRKMLDAAGFKRIRNIGLPGKVFSIVQAVKQADLK